MKETQSIDPQPHQFIDRSDLKGLLALAKDWGAIFLIAIFSYWVNNLFVSLLAIWFIGCFQVAIGESLLHEASHYNLFKTRSWNDRLRFLYALPFFLTLDEYRIQHANHHKYLMTEKDILLEEYERLGFTKTQKKLFFLWFIKPFFVAPIFLLQFIWDDIKLMSSQNKIEISIFWLGILFIFYWLECLPFLLLYWFVPYIFVYSVIFYWTEVQDHYNTKTGTRSRIDPIHNFFSHNKGYHQVHHICPSIPWYNLPKAHAILVPDEAKQDITNGFFDVYRQMQGVGIVSENT
ncbi:fatty acid desaturase family protein [Spirulina sp. 06S082]|jgi:fatty acid desaturase|uniref:fatty acid desaturase family protein n=1 Tax=Spirulina sp. 06S082 TaxID=3110248 RepID=UPI002B20D26B|nr:fatty acid desaturase [Spirulina sp. 06S082]MEA5470451.1 fatty acid desaturase [Spirulina sp. 06S082]